MDKISKERRSWNMSQVRGKNTKPEIIVRSLLHKMGYRFSLRRVDLPGKPDIVLPKYNAVVFVHGCFWHQHKGCNRAKLPETNRSFWGKKLTTNVERDGVVKIKLELLGWNVITVWECALAKSANHTLSILIKRIGKPS